MTATTPVQQALDIGGTPLANTTFVVVDLETTGGSADESEITEIGAVKVCGGERLGEFRSLVRPAGPIPPFVAVLTGISDATVAGAPPLSAVLPSFLEFAHGSTLVAHNAPFDIGFLKAAATRLEYPWPEFRILDTARLARRVVTRDEAPNCKLGTLAGVFRATTTPTHRALDDARATVDVLHGLFERLGNRGVHTIEELLRWQSAVTPAQRAKRHLVDDLPESPGVYVFRDGDGEPLYVGKSTNIRRRARTYFTASETRARMTEMVSIAEAVTGIECATPLEAEVRELRLIAEHKPRYNKRSRFPERSSWLKLTVEPFPRLSIVRRVADDAATYLGPFSRRRLAEDAMAALHEAVPLRQCTVRLSPQRTREPCVLAEMGRCGAPCAGHETVETYGRHVREVQDAITADPRVVVDRLLSRIRWLAGEQRYEDAARHRDRLAAFVRVAARSQRIAAIAAVPELAAARARDGGGWDLHVVRYGRLAAAGSSPPGAHPRPYLDALLATAQTVTPPVPPTPAASTEEAECVLRWLETPPTRLVEITGTWTHPVGGAAGLAHLVDAAEDDLRAARPFDDRRALRPAG